MNRFFLLIQAIAALAVGCRHSISQPSELLHVQVVSAKVDTLPEHMTFIGTLDSNFDAVIQPRVNGYLLSANFKSGQPVRRGSVLFTIDPAQFSTTMLAARAALESAKAQLTEARNNYERAVPLARINAISRAQLDQYTAAYKAARAAVQSAEQTLRAAQLDVGYTELRAPIDGIVAHSAAHVGDYVGPNTQFEVLTTVSSIDTLTVDLAIPMNRYLQLAPAEMSLYDNAGLLSRIYLLQADGTRYPYEGSYAYTRKDISASTGTLVLVVRFPNPDNLLKPGQFARVRAAIGEAKPRILVPQLCVSQMQGVNSVWVVAADSTVSYRRVVLGNTFDDMWCVEEGLMPEERVVVSGQMKLRDGMKIIPQSR